MLTLREKYNTSESAVEYAVDELSNILQVTSDDFAAEIQSEIQQKGAATDVPELLHQQLSNSVGDCQKLSSIKKLKKHMKSSMIYVAPEEHILGYSVTQFTHSMFDTFSLCQSAVCWLSIINIICISLYASLNVLLYVKLLVFFLSLPILLSMSARMLCVVEI